MKVINANSKTEAVVNDFLKKLNAHSLAKQNFFIDWAKALSHKEALEIAHGYSLFMPDLELESYAAYLKMTAAIADEIINAPFKSTEWRV
jgi:hypothetical protein